MNGNGISPETLMMRVYDVTVWFVVRIQAPNQAMAERAAKNVFHIALGNIDAIQEAQTSATELLFGAEKAPKGPRNPSRTDIGEDGHKVDPPATKLALDEDAA